MFYSRMIFFQVTLVHQLNIFNVNILVPGYLVGHGK